VAATVGLVASRRASVQEAFDALTAAGHAPDVVKVYGLASLPDVTRGRKEVKRLTGESFVPVLVLDDGEVIKDSQRIVEWARAHSIGVASH
jgi:Tfp pilus assembly PilM family ATPase